VEVGIHEDHIRTASENGPAVLVTISRQADGNTVAIADAAHAIVSDFRARYPDIQFSFSYDQAPLVRESIASVRDAIILGLILAVVVVFLFTSSLVSAVVAAIVVPCTVAITFVVMKVAGVTFNMMTLGGLAAAGGLVIDDAIVVVENIVLHRDGGEGPLRATASALKELTIPLIGSTLTPIVVFLPLISITGVTGTFFRALAIAMSVSLLTSLVLALSWTTNLGTFLIRRGKGGEESELNGANGTNGAEEFANGVDGGQGAGSTAGGESAEMEQIRRMMAAEEASLRGGWF